MGLVDVISIEILRDLVLFQVLGKVVKLLSLENMFAGHFGVLVILHFAEE